MKLGQLIERLEALRERHGSDISVVMEYGEAFAEVLIASYGEAYAVATADARILPKVKETIRLTYT